MYVLCISILLWFILEHFMQTSFTNLIDFFHQILYDSTPLIMKQSTQVPAQRVWHLSNPAFITFAVAIKASWVCHKHVNFCQVILELAKQPRSLS